MGQEEVLAWLEDRRKSGDHAYRSYAQIHKAMVNDGKTLGYQGIWWSITCLFDQGRIEGKALGTVLSRRWVFRGKPLVRSTKLDRVYNTYRTIDQKSGRTNTKGQSFVRRGRLDG